MSARSLACTGAILAALGLSSAHAQSTGLVPDNYRLLSDGDDDAPSIQRAVTAICAGAGTRVVRLRGRHYAINSHIVQTCFAEWIGEGWAEQPPVAANAAGTWLDIGAAFAVPGSPCPIEVYGDVSGTTFADIAFAEPGMTPAPVAVRDGGGNITGWSPATWAPVPYLPIFNLQGAPGVSFRHILLDGINAGITATNSGRLGLYDVRGQVFAYIATIQQSFDVVHIDGIHQWPYWALSDPVYQFQQAHTSTLVSLRNDSPFIDHFFSFGTHAGIEFGNETLGVTTGAQIGAVSCDATQYCLWDRADPSAPSQITLQIAQLRTFGAALDSITGHSQVMLPGSTAIQLDGTAMMQIGQIENFGTDASIVTFNNGALPSNIEVGSIKGISRSGSSAVVAKFPTVAPGGNSILSIALPPMLTGDWPTFSNNAAGGVGLVQFPAPTAVH